MVKERGSVFVSIVLKADYRDEKEEKTLD